MGDRKIERLLVGDAQLAKSRPLANTTVLEKLAEARDKSFWTQLGVSPPMAGARSTWTRERRARMTLMEDTPCDVTLGTIAGVAPEPVKVLLVKPWSKRLKVDISTGTLEYLRKVARAEIEGNQVEHVHPRLLVPMEKRFDNVTGVSGLTARYDQNGNIQALRLQKFTQDSESPEAPPLKRTKTFRLHDMGLERAMTQVKLCFHSCGMEGTCALDRPERACGGAVDDIAPTQLDTDGDEDDESGDERGPLNMNIASSDNE